MVDTLAVWLLVVTCCPNACLRLQTPDCDSMALDPSCVGLDIPPDHLGMVSHGRSFGEKGEGIIVFVIVSSCLRLRLGATCPDGRLECYGFRATRSNECLLAWLGTVNIRLVGIITNPLGKPLKVGELVVVKCVPI